MTQTKTEVLSERHGKRVSAAAGARPIETFARAAEPPKRRVPADLDPRSFAHRTGISNDDRDHDPALAAAFGAAASMHRGLEAIFARERTIRADATQTPEAHKRSIARMVERQSADPMGANDTAYKTVRRALDDIETELQKSVRSRLPREDAAELRQVIRIMEPKKRNAYLAERVKAGDHDVIAAVLAQKPVASGLTELEAARWRREYEQAHHGDLIARRAKLEKAADALQDIGQTFLRETLGMTDQREVKRLDEAAAAAEEAVS